MGMGINFGAPLKSVAGANALSPTPSYGTGLFPIFSCPSLLMKIGFMFSMKHYMNLSFCDVT